MLSLDDRKFTSDIIDKEIYNGWRIIIALERLRLKLTKKTYLLSVYLDFTL